MSTERRVLVFRHMATMTVLLLLDGHRKLRRLFSREFLFTLVGLLAAGLLVVMVSSLLALRQVTRSIESLTGNSMVRLESALALRTMVRQTQLNLLRLQVGPGQLLDAVEAARFETIAGNLMQSYRASTPEGKDLANVTRIEGKLDEYMHLLRLMTPATSTNAIAIKAADETARELIEAIELAYAFNRERVHERANEARDAARMALQISNRLWWSFGLFALFTAMIYFAYRCLAIPEDGNA